MVLSGGYSVGSNIVYTARIATSNCVSSTAYCTILWDLVVDRRNALLNKETSFNKKKKEVLPVEKISKGVS